MNIIKYADRVMAGKYIRCDFISDQNKPLYMDATDLQIKKALVSFAIEKSLLEMGEPVFHKVANTLKDDYNCYIPDCYEHPEYLKRVLANLYGNAHVSIINSIKSDLAEFSNQGPVQKFILALS